VDPSRADVGLRDDETSEGIRIDRWPELTERNSKGKVRSRRSEQVAAVERARDRLERVVGIRKLVCLGDPAQLLGGPLSGPT
jgi:hypothetical protein